MSFEPPAGILDIGNATLRVGKLEVTETAGLNQGLQNIVKNDLLITETDSYTTPKSWGLKLPTTWVAEFDLQGQTGKYVEFNFYNEGSTSNTQGYTLNFKDTSLTLKYDNGSTLASATIPTIVGTFRKVHIFFERNVIAVSIDGTRYLYDKRPSVLSRVISTTGSAFLNAFIQSDHGGNSIFKNLRIVNGRFISDQTSNIAFVGGNLGVGVHSPQETLDIRGNMHFNRVSNVSQISVDSNVVTEYTGPHDRPLRKYPEVAMTADAETASGYKGYKIDRSSVYGSNPAWIAFDDEVTTSSWLSAEDSYTQAGPATGASAVDTFESVDGSWLNIQLPNKIRLDYIIIKNRTSATIRNAKAGILWAKHKSESTWYRIHDFSGLNTAHSATNTIHVNETNVYDEYRLQVTEIEPYSAASLNGILSIGEWELYGHEEGSGSLDTTLKSVYNVPATTGTQLEVYYDAKGESTVQSPIPDLSPNTNTGAVSGHSPTLDSTDGIDSFKFNGSSQYVTGTHGLTTGSDPVHTISLWFKRIAKVGQFEYLVQLGQGGTSHQQSAIFLHDDKIAHGHWGGGVYHTDVITDNVWYHIAATYTGGNTSDLSTHKIYVNGVEIGIDAYSSDGPLVLTGTALTLGRNENALGSPGGYFNGSIANFRLYSKALNADQVKELYDYQKDYFLGSKSQVTLYKGHLGVGVTEPSGQLELAGDERIQEYPPGPMDGYETLIPGHGVFCAYASSYYTTTDTYVAWKAFDKTEGTFWVSDDTDTPETYHQTTGLYTGTRRLSEESVLGEYIILKLPYSINLKSFTIEVRSTELLRGPKSGIVYGRKNNKWEAVHSFSGVTYTTAVRQNIQVINPNEYYNEFALVTTALAPNGDTYHNVNLVELKYFGTPGPTTLDKGSLTLGRSLDVPRISRYDVDTETPRPEKLVVDLDTTVNNHASDISGQGNHGVFYNGASYSPADKAFTFDGVNDYIEAVTNLGSGNQTLSFSMWINTHTDSRWFMWLGSEATGGGMGIYRGSSTYKIVIRSGGNLEISAGPLNTWEHLVFVYDSATGAFKGYLNGEPGNVIGSVIDTVDVFSLAANPPIEIGARTTASSERYFDGQISNFKLYNVALEPSEVKKLYNLGRTGRSMVISDTAVGIGKVPEAQLDVRGSVGVAGYLGIGVNPGDSLGGVLHVATRHGNSIENANRRYFRYDIAIRTGDGSARGSIYGRYEIISSSYFISTAGTVSASDERIKKNIIDVNDSSALTTLRLLKPKRYQYRDTVERGTEPVWGFIAQEVRDTLPYATQLRTEFVPNIYQLATVSESNVITFSEFNTSELEDSKILRVISSSDEEHEVRITEIIDDNTIRVNTNLDMWTGSVDDGNIVSRNQIFVYGQKIDDFIFVKKDAIWTIATAALQEVDRQLQFERARNDALEARVTALEQAKYM
jgi:hypothetical protein